ncbi:hypothetical protein ACN28S_22985 [Cystobacter fuscus]
MSRQAAAGQESPQRWAVSHGNCSQRSTVEPMTLVATDRRTGYWLVRAYVRAWLAREEISRSALRSLWRRLTMSMFITAIEANTPAIATVTRISKVVSPARARLVFIAALPPRRSCAA